MPAKSIKDVLHKAGNEYPHAYAVAIARTEKFPEAVNGILARLFRAIAEKKYDEAQSLTEDACVLCYAVAASGIWKEVSDTRYCIKKLHGPMPKMLEQKFVMWRREKKSLIKRNGGNGVDIVRARSCVAAGEALLEEMCSEYNLEPGGAKDIRKRVWWARAKTLLVGPVSAVALGMLVDAYFAELQGLLSLVMK